jgi:very-short-patch-repair endonuclease
VAAADEWGFEEVRSAEIHLSSTKDLRMRMGGVVRHRVRDLPRFDTTRWHGLPITTPLRTLLDVSAVLPIERLEFPFEYVLRTGLVSPSLLTRRVHEADLRGRPGIGKLRRLMGDDGARMQSALEVIVKQAVAKGQLPRPTRQFIITNESGFVAQPDFSYPQIRLGWEAHGWRWHFGRERSEADLERLNRIQNAGWRMLYITKRQLDDGPDRVVATIRTAIGGQLPGLIG